jgi:ABC-2 type transport system permease protein
MSALVAYFVQVGFLFRKELLALLKDRSSRVILLVPVVMQSLLFGYGATFDLNHVPYAVLDLSGGRSATDLLARVDGTGVFRRSASLRSPGEIAGVIDADDALLVLAIPSDFEDRLASGKGAPLQVILDGRNSSTAALALAHISAIVQAYNQSLATAAGTPGPAVSIERRAWYNPNLESRWYVMPALIATLSMIQTMMLAALSVAREREQGTFDQLLVTPLTPVQILIGKALPAMLVGLVQATLILLVIRVWFQIPMQGSPALLYLGLLTFTGAVVGVGLSISALSISMQQAMLYTFFLIMPLVLLSGLITPVRNMPEILQVLTYANPLRFGMDFVRRVYLEGAGLSQVASDFLPMLAVAAVTLPLASWLFRNRLA